MSDTKYKDEESKIVDGAGRPLSKSRRRFLAHSGMYTAGLVGSALLGACSDNKNVALAQNDGNDDNDPNTITINGPSDAAVLQFALNLEYLEAEYYLKAVTGMGLHQDDTTAMSGGMSAGTVTYPDTDHVDFSDEGLIGRYAAEIAADELHHVQFLRSGLKDAGGLIARPSINLNSSFNFAATAALRGAGVIDDDSTATFDPYASPLAFLIGAFIFEDVGVTAYKGGAQFLRNRQFLTAAAGILSVEGYHAGLVRTVLTARAADGEMVTFNTSEGDKQVPLGAAINAISDARDSVDGDTDDDQGISGDDFDTVEIYNQEYDATNIVPTDSNGITYSRSVPHVHNVVYLTPNMVSPDMGNVPSTSFFPDGTDISANPALEASGGDAPSGDDDSTPDNGMSDDDDDSTPENGMSGDDDSDSN